jgi:hypothetical protein
VILIALPKMIQFAMPSAAAMPEAHAVFQAAVMTFHSAKQFALIQVILLHVAAEHQLLVIPQALALAGSVLPVQLPAMGIVIVLMMATL